MKGKIIEEIKLLKTTDPKSFKLLAEEIRKNLNTSTDDESTPRNNTHIVGIKKEAFENDANGNNKLLNAVEEGDIKKIREMYNGEKSFNDTELLKKIAIDIMDKSILTESSLSKDIISTIYSEIKYQLKLAGEDTSEVIDDYNL